MACWVVGDHMTNNDVSSNYRIKCRKLWHSLGKGNAGINNSMRVNIV